MSSFSNAAPLRACSCCYIPCSVCNAFFAVSVPCNSMLEAMAIRCAQCNNICSVIPNHQPKLGNDPQVETHGLSEYRIRTGSSSKLRNELENQAASPDAFEKRVVNKPPSKRHRAPSLYNQFIKEEIQRIKLNNPDISHREAFSTASKNWARFPNLHFGLMLETSDQASNLQDEAGEHLKQLLK